MKPAARLDQELLERLRRRDAGALEEAVREHARPLFRTARAMGFSAQESEDLVQDVFATFFEKLDRFEGRSQLRTWLVGILHHKALERRRELAQDQKHDPIDDIFESRFDPRGNWIQPPADLERVAMSNEAGELIYRCMEKLPPNQREAFVLREIEELETPDICKILGISVTNMGVLMYRARARLRECLEGLGWSQL